MKNKIEKLLDNIEKIKQRREERRQVNKSLKSQRLLDMEQTNGRGGQYDQQFEQLFNQNRFQRKNEEAFGNKEEKPILIVVRKRPLLRGEVGQGCMDCVDAHNPWI